MPVLDERRELFWWDTGNYFFLPGANPPKPGRHWWYAYARTLPGYPTLTREVRQDLADDGEPTA